MASIKKLIQSGVAAVTLALAGGGVAQAQTYSESRLMQADINVAQANYNAANASCNSRLFGNSRSLGRSLANGVESRACRADAQADYLDRVAQIQRRYNVPNGDTLRAAYNARSQAIRFEYDADIAQCNARLADTFGRRADWQDRARNSANAQRCQANAEATYYRNAASAEQRYSRQIQQGNRR